MVTQEPDGYEGRSAGDGGHVIPRNHPPTDRRSSEPPQDTQALLTDLSLEIFLKTIFLELILLWRGRRSSRFLRQKVKGQQNPENCGRGL